MKRLIRCASVLAVLILACSSGGGAAIGDACTAATDCQSGLTCNDDPGGQCTMACKVDADCPEGSICEIPGNCYHHCTSKADCPRAGYDCVGGPNSSNEKWCDPIPPADAGTD